MGENRDEILENGRSKNGNFIEVVNLPNQQTTNKWNYICIYKHTDKKLWHSHKEDRAAPLTYIYTNVHTYAHMD